MREIKFRIWSKQVKTMWLWETIKRNSIVALDSNLPNKENFIALPILNSDNVLIQYTGMKDKNGTDIYDGDVIQCKCGMYRIDGTPTDKISITNYVVKWETDNARWGRFSKGKFELLCGLNQTYLDKWYTVIGNIYENPELLK